MHYNPTCIMDQPHSSTGLTAERVRRVITNVKILLEGCSPVQRMIEWLLERFQERLIVGEPLIVSDEVGTLVFGLCRCSSECVEANSIEGVVRVEVVNRVLFSALAKFKDPFDMLAHLERLTQNPDNHLTVEIVEYGYQGITVTKTGSLQVVTADVLGCGDRALDDANRLEPMLVDEMIRFWFWGHWRRLACCLWTGKMYEESLPWLEASLRVARKFSTEHQAATSEHTIGEILTLMADCCVILEEKVELVRRAVTRLEKSIHLFGDYLGKADATTLYVIGAEGHGNLQAEARSTVALLHRTIGMKAYEVLKDRPLSLQHFAKGAETAAVIADLRAESFCWLNCGTVLLEYMPDKLEEVLLYFRRSLKAALKMNRTAKRALSAIYTASEYFMEIVMRLAPSRENKTSLFFPCIAYAEYPWIHPDLSGGNRPPTWLTACARAKLYLGIAKLQENKYEESIKILQCAVATLLEEEPPETDATVNNWLRLLSAIIHSILGRTYHLLGKYEDAAKHFGLSAQFHDHDLKTKLAESLRQVSALHLGDDDDRALEVVKELLSLQGLTESDVARLRAGLLSCKGIMEYYKEDYEESIRSLEEARKIYHDSKCVEIPDAASVHTFLVLNYLVTNNHWTASNLVKDFQPVVDEYHKGGLVWQTWQVVKAMGQQMVGDSRGADKFFEQVEVPKLAVGDRTGVRAAADYTVEDGFGALETAVRASVYRIEDDFESALENYDTMENSLRENAPNRSIALAEIRLNRAATLVRDVNNEAHMENAVEESQQAADLFRKEQGHPIKLARALTCQAVALWNLKETRDMDQHPTSELQLLDEAIELVESRDRLLLAKCKHIKACITRRYDPLSSEAEGREAALIFAELQLELKDMESAWVTMFGSDMKHNFIFMQKLMQWNEAPLKALLWAERGRMRLFVHKSRKQTLRKFSAKPTTDCDAFVKTTDCESFVKPDCAGEDIANAVNELTADFQALGLISCPPEEIQHLGQISCPAEETQDLEQISYPAKEIKDLGQISCPADEIQDLEQIPCPARESRQRGGDGDQDLILSDELWFDKYDGLAEKYLFQAVAKCGPGALVLEYTFLQAPERVYIYAAFIELGERMVVEMKISTVDLQTGVDGKVVKKRKFGKTLTTLIHKTREFIVNKDDAQAIEGLSLLHSLLIDPVEEYVQKCDKLILATHEQLALVPFAALYNKSSRKFLIQEKTISYIPSIRVMHHCLNQQEEFEQDMRMGLLGVPFVAGNPEPMGWGMQPLPGAAEEAKVVAEILGVEPCLGPDMNKEAVMKGLSNQSMVLLATHGVVDAFFPHGALILRGRSSSLLPNESILMRSLITRGILFERMRDASSLGVVDGSADAAIDSDELARLPGGIGAGLVVLSACKSANGEVTSEGVLGLGRSLLQGGAASAILSLWNVSDSKTKVLISGVFEHLVKQGKDAAQALQLTMLQMIDNREMQYKICHWAPMLLFGSPNFRYTSAPLRRQHKTINDDVNDTISSGK